MKRSRSVLNPQDAKLGADGIAICAGGSRLYYCPLASRWFYSVSTDALCDRALMPVALRDHSLSDNVVVAIVVDEGDKGGGADGLESYASGCLYATHYEHSVIVRRRPNGEWETVLHDPRLLWLDTMSVAVDGYL